MSLNEGDFVRNTHEGNWVDSEHISRDKFKVSTTWEVLKKTDGSLVLRNLANGRTYTGMPLRRFRRI